jgi:hypothetical protein
VFAAVLTACTRESSEAAACVHYDSLLGRRSPHSQIHIVVAQVHPSEYPCVLEVEEVSEHHTQQETRMHLQNYLIGK